MPFKLNLKCLGDAILYSSISFAIASVEMSSKFSVKNFSKDNETLQNAADALSDYMKIGCLWAVGTTLVLYCNFGVQGAVTSVVMNSIIMVWIYTSYQKAFKLAATKNGLSLPTVKLFF